MNAFETYLRQRWHAADVDALFEGLAAPPSVSVRVNPRRLDAAVPPEGADGCVPWCTGAYYLAQRPVFTADPLFHAGAYYVQDASSMFLAHVYAQLSSIINQQSSILDLCAAPGGKSTLLRSLLPDDALLVSNEPVRQRTLVLAENIAKWGHPNVVVTQAYPRDFGRFIGCFDLILADVPCSGEGMMRKEEVAVTQWSPQLVEQCAALQRSIIADVWPALRPGGILIYSTCTFNPEEDEDNVEWIAHHLGADIIPIPVDPTWGICGDMRKSASEAASPLPCYHFLPGRIRGEGLFCAVLRKREDPNVSRRNLRLEQLTVLPTDQLDADGAPQINVNLTDAFRYLCREAIVLPPDTPRGIVQIAYRGQRLGLAKNIGNRANNLYPKEWRIRNAQLTPHSIFLIKSQYEKHDT